ncbi:MAG: hypothetical protein ACLPUO_07425 [Streptosporangiaceae bacterium]
MTDARVRAAIAHWAPRFLSAGVDASDFSVITSGIGSWVTGAPPGAPRQRSTPSSGGARSATPAAARAARTWPGPPAIVLVPGLDSAKEDFRAVEQHFLDRGMAILSVDGPGQGEAEYDLAIRPDREAPGGAILDAPSGRPGIDRRPG